jgi:hypothetical protein
MVRIIPLIFLFFMPFTAIKAQQDVKTEKYPWLEITAAMSNGDARELAAWFNRMVDLGLPEKDNSYSKSQGEIVMRDFFKKYPPDSFEVRQKGKTSETSHFAICQYTTGDKKFQVSIYLMHESGTFLITKIKFEKQE